jgi:hypothetical protein
MTLVFSDWSQYRTDIAAWGWTDVDFAAVDAPLCHNDPDVPPADSRDPLRPGVVVLSVGEGQRQSLAIGTLSNVLTGPLAFDGCGVGLTIEAWDGRCFSGHWGNAGMAIGRDGAFSLCVTR